MATVLRVNEEPKAVKNLGWLLRHWASVQWLGFNYDPDDKRMIDGQLVAKLRDGTTYLTDYASLSVCWNFLNRPVFKGRYFHLWNMGPDTHKVFTIGDAEWKRINRLDYGPQMAAILE